MTLKYKALTDPGQLRQRVQVKTVVRTPDAYGGYARADTVLKTYSAHVQSSKSLEVNEIGQLQSREMLIITFRYNTDVKQGSTLVYRGQTLYVHSVENSDHEKRFLVAVCRLGGPL